MFPAIRVVFWYMYIGSHKNELLKWNAEVFPVPLFKCHHSHRKILTARCHFILAVLNIFRAQLSQTWLHRSHYPSANVWMSTPCKHLWHTCLNATGELTKHSWVFPIKVSHSSTTLQRPVSHAPNGKRAFFFSYISIFFLVIFYI